MIHIHTVTKRYGRVTALHDVSARIRPGEALALWGHNGAGKTTLIRCLLGVIRYEGEVTIAGVDVRRDGKRARALVGYVPQELAFHDDTQLGAAMAFFAELRRVGRRDAAAALRAVGLEGHDSKRLRELSGGMKQRLAMAIALLSDPPVIVLDEPTSNLDAAGRRAVVEMLRDLRTGGKTIVFASHRSDEVLALADRVLVLDDGRLVEDRVPGELWPGEGPGQRLRLHVAEGQETSALAVLDRGGHVAELNGNGLCVTTPRNRKGDPITLLVRSEIDVRDFEVLADPSPHGEGS